MRELFWGLRAVSHEVERWRAHACLIPERQLRDDALCALETKRANIDGAALFWTLPTARSPALLRTLVAYEAAADYLDCTSERAAHVGVENGLQLHEALVDALDPARPPTDYYRHHPWKHDGGYLRRLVEECRAGTYELPSWGAVRPFALEAARKAMVLPLNHEPETAARDGALHDWVSIHVEDQEELAWFEWSGGASAWLTILALLALAADPGRTGEEAALVYDAYLPWISLTGTMLDSYGDAVTDTTFGDHSYIAHYRTRLHATARLHELVKQALRSAAALPEGERHVALTSAMVAMYLSKQSTRTRDKKRDTRHLIKTAGATPRVLTPVLRTWRAIHGLQTDVPKRNHDNSHRCQPDSPDTDGETDELPRHAPIPVVAQTLAFWRDPHRYLAWCRKRYGRRFTVHALGMAPLVFLSDPREIKAMLKAPADVLHPGTGAAVIAPLVGEGSFMLAEEHDHLRGRRASLAGFHQTRVDAHHEQIVRIVEKAVNAWPRDTVFALHPHLRALTLRVILNTIFGTDFPREYELHARLLRMLAVNASLALQEPELRRIAPWRSLWTGFTEERNEVHRIIDGLLEEVADGRIAGGAPTHALLNASHAEDSATQVRDDLMSLLLAGHETTASELAWAFQLLAHSPGVAQRLTRTLEADDERYLMATVQEVLRHRPVFLFAIPRTVNAPYELGGHRYLPPAQLAACIHLMHHDPLLYEEPERFNPQRFYGRGPPPDLWLPWGGGRKRCPGHHLAMFEMSAVLRHALITLKIEPTGRRVETARWRSVIVTPGQGSRIMLRAKRRTAFSFQTSVHAPSGRSFLT
jgi:cytochrome P450